MPPFTDDQIEEMASPGSPWLAVMDSEIVEAVRSTLGACTPQEFLKAYAWRHQARYGEPFIAGLRGIP
jgi:hypothetical protein